MLWVSTDLEGDRGGFLSFVFDAVFWRTGVSDKFGGCVQVQNAAFREKSSHHIDWQAVLWGSVCRLQGIVVKSRKCVKVYLLTFGVKSKLTE